MRIKEIYFLTLTTPLSMLSTEQKAIIRKICKEQEKSLLRVAERYTEKIYNDLMEEGYDVDFSDIAAEIGKQLEIYDRAKESPELFLQLLDESSVDMIKHHLIQDYEGHPDSKGIWKKLNLRDKYNTYLN